MSLNGPDAKSVLPTTTAETLIHTSDKLDFHHPNIDKFVDVSTVVRPLIDIKLRI